MRGSCIAEAYVGDQGAAREQSEDGRRQVAIKIVYSAFDIGSCTSAVTTCCCLFVYWKGASNDSPVHSVNQENLEPTNLYCPIARVNIFHKAMPLQVLLRGDLLSTQECISNSESPCSTRLVQRFYPQQSRRSDYQYSLLHDTETRDTD